MTTGLVNSVTNASPVTFWLTQVFPGPLHISAVRTSAFVEDGRVHGAPEERLGAAIFLCSSAG